MADISKLKTPDGTTYSLKDETARAGLEGKAPASHTHTKSQITDFPTSLPANGGNADTVGGHTVNAEVPDIAFAKELDGEHSATSGLNNGTYYCSKWTDYPTSSPNNQGTLIVDNFNSNGGISPWSHRTFYNPFSNKIWHGFTANNTWYGWNELSWTPIKSTSFSTNTDGTGNFNLWVMSENKVPIFFKLDNKTFYAVPFLYNNQAWMGSTISEISRQPVANIDVSGTVYYIEE